MDERDFKRNGSGYVDPTAYEAIKHVSEEKERFDRFLGVLFSICELADFHIEERIVVKDKRTGKVWR